MKDEIRNIWVVGILFVIVFGVIIASIFESGFKEQIADDKINDKIKSFSSYSELEDFLKKSLEESSGYGQFGALEKSVRAPSAAFADSGSRVSASEAQADDYSQTNIQVEGVDEADIVKNDGKYIYTIVGNKVVIANAFPAENMKIASEIEIKNNILEIFVNNDKLIVFTQGYEPVVASEDDSNEESVVRNVEVSKRASAGVATDVAIAPWYSGDSKVYVYIYDISDREKPELDDEISFDGNYIDSRMIDDYIYVVSNKYIENNRPILPVYKLNGVEERIALNSIYYFDYVDYNYVFNSISSINVKNGDIESKIYMTGASNNIYVSENNIYLTYTKWISGREYWEKSIEEAIMPLLPENLKEEIENILNSKKGLNERIEEVNIIIQDYSNSLRGEEKAEFDKELYESLRDFELEIRKESERTVIHKINVDEEKIEYKEVGEVPGTVLNQFSMDEHNNNFRIATTSGQIWDGSSDNNLYVLNEELNIIGKIEKLAPGERIYSARFIGDRAYLVTFKKIDPFFVIDLSDSNNPEVLGYLKIPGYSDYLHPYDENHIIGIGKEAVDANEEGFGRDFAWYQGLKIAIFDVRDIKNPRERAKIVVGDRGTDSYALHDHKAFLFDKKRNLLVMPVSLAEIDKTEYQGEIPASAYGETVWQGAYIFDIRLDEIKIKGRITHYDVIDKERYGYYGPESIQRALYMNDVLYTLSLKKIKASDLDDLREISYLNLPYSENYGEVIIY